MRHSLAVVRAFVAIHRAVCVTTVPGRRLRGLAALRDVFATAHNLDLGDLQALLFTRNFDAQVAGGFAGGDGGFRINRSRRRLCGRLLLFTLPFLVILFRVGIRGVVVRRNRARETRIHFRLDATCIGAAAESVRLVCADEGDVEVGLDCVFQSHRPEDAIHEQAAITLVRDVLRGAVKRREHAARFAVGALVGARPLARHRRLRFVGRRIRRHAVERLRHRQNVTIGRFAHITARLHPHILHAAQNRIRRLLGDDGDACALLVIRAVMPHPRLTEHLMTETGFVTGGLGVVIILGVGLRRAFEGMCGGAQPDHRSAAIQVGIEVLHLLRRQSLEAQKHHGEIRRVQRLHAGDVLRFTSGDVAIRVDVEKHRAFEPLMLRQNARQRRQRLLRAIFVIP